MSSEYVIESEYLVKSFGSVTAIDSISLQVRRGECFGLLGPNGAGKSSFIALVYGASQRTSGRLKVLGWDPQKQSRQIKKRVGIVTQENALDEDLTVQENMELYAAFQGLSRQEGQTRVRALLDYMQLGHKGGAPIRQLSGGMKRRLVFVRALLGNPECVVLDEPTTGLDPAVRHLLWNKVKQLQAQGTTILLTTHYMHEAEVLCDRVAVLDKGRVIDTNSPRALIEKHSPGYVSVYGLENEAAVDEWISEQESLAKYRDSSGIYLVAPTLEQLVSLSHQTAVRPQLMRPANLEDVFLRLTGQELSTDA